MVGAQGRSWISIGPEAVLWHAWLRRALHGASANGVSTAADGHALLPLPLQASFSSASCCSERQQLSRSSTWRLPAGLDAAAVRVKSRRPAIEVRLHRRPS